MLYIKKYQARQHKRKTIMKNLTIAALIYSALTACAPSVDRPDISYSSDGGATFNGHSSRAVEPTELPDPSRR